MIGFERVKTPTRVHNPNKTVSGKRPVNRKKSPGSAAAQKRRKSNPGPLLIELSGLAAGNPQKERKGMKTKRNSGRTSAAKKTNPTYTKKRVPRKNNPSAKGHRRRRNPNTFASKGIGTLKNGFWALVGLVITRQLPQMLLKEKNAGPMGYLANAGAAFAASMAITKFAGQDAGSAALIGGGLYLTNRVIQENFSPVGRVLSLQGMGDAMALGEVLTGDRTYFPEPVAYDNNRNPIIPDQIRQRPLPVMAAAGMGNYRRRVAA
jgi:hypothetical protein